MTADVPAENVEPVGTVADTTVPAPGGPVPLRVYPPHADAVGVVVYLHGGGHVTGTLDSYDGLTRRLANRVPATVVSVGYRRVPEHRCPAAVEDADAAYTWALAQARTLARDSAGRVAVAGDSAGGSNTAVLARRLRDAGAPPPVLQVLIYPPVDAVACPERSTCPSRVECGQGFGLASEDEVAYWRHYLGPGGHPASLDASPIRAASLAGLPPAYVLAAEYDVLRDEAEAYARALAAAGVHVQHCRWNGHLHGFLGDPASFDDADPALEEIATAIRVALTTGPQAAPSHRRTVALNDPSAGRCSGWSPAGSCVVMWAWPRRGALQATPCWRHRHLHRPARHGGRAAHGQRCGGVLRLRQTDRMMSEEPAFARDAATAAYYDQRAGEYDEWYTEQGRFAGRDRPGWGAEVEAVVALVQALPAVRTLDVACGSGFLTRHLSGFVVGLDQSPAMVALAQSRLPGGLALTGDALDTPFADGAFDRVLTGHFYGHLPLGERGAFLAEARRVAGELVVVDSALRPGMDVEQWQERVLNDGSRHRVFKRYLGAEQLADEIDGEVLFVGTWFVAARSR